jgi:hypothetical protein
MMDRRAFLIASIAVTVAPSAAVAQSPTKGRRIGYLGPLSPSAGARLLESFPQASGISAT